MNKLEEKEKALRGFIWLSSNMHKYGSPQWRDFFEEAIKDAEKALEPEKETCGEVKYLSVVVLDVGKPQRIEARTYECESEPNHEGAHICRELMWS